MYPSLTRREFPRANTQFPGASRALGLAVENRARLSAPSLVAEVRSGGNDPETWRAARSKKFKRLLPGQARGKCTLQEWLLVHSLDRPYSIRVLATNEFGPTDSQSFGLNDLAQIDVRAMSHGGTGEPAPLWARRGNLRACGPLFRLWFRAKRPRVVGCFGEK